MKLIHCEFNIDTASVELRFADGTEVSIYTQGWMMRFAPLFPCRQRSTG